MARGAQDQAKKTFTESQDAYNTSTANSNALYKQLFPALNQEATSPQGFDPKDLSAMRTAGEQSLGGATAGAVGEGDLLGARTRNAGGFAPALDEAVRSGQRELSQRAVETEGTNAALKESQRQAGLSGLGNLYGTNTSNMLNSLGIGNQSTKTLTDAGQSGWFQNFLGLMTALKPGGSVGGGQNASASFGG